MFKGHNFFIRLRLNMHPDRHRLWYSTAMSSSYSALHTSEEDRYRNSFWGQELKWITMCPARWSTLVVGICFHLLQDSALFQLSTDWLCRNLPFGGTILIIDWLIIITLKSSLISLIMFLFLILKQRVVNGKDGQISWLTMVQSRTSWWSKFTGLVSHFLYIHIIWSLHFLICRHLISLCNIYWHHL